MQEKINITVNHTIIIEQRRETVFDFTQDFSKRMLWDSSFESCDLISEFPERMVRVKAKGGIMSTLVYKHFERPSKTSLRMTDISSPLILDGGGSWTYEETEGRNTRWTQTNTLSLPKTLTGRILKYFVRRALLRNTIKSMGLAKTILEREASDS